MNTEVTKTARAEEPRRWEDYQTPLYEVEKNEDAYCVRVFLPGVGRNDASVTLEKDTLLVEARRSSHADESWRVVHREIPSGDFRLELELNIHVDEKSISATSTNGVLNIQLPIAEQAKPRSIKIT